MLELAESLFGPLIEPECRRAVSRRWVFVIKWLAALTASAVVLIVWWIGIIMLRYNPEARPTAVVKAGLMMVEWLAVSASLLLSPALLAGTLAEEKSRGTLGLLLITHVSPAEIVLSRLVSRFLQMLIILLASAPALSLMAATTQSASQVLLLLALPASVAFGGAGMALAASVLARRARDALVGIYGLGLLVLFGPGLISLLWPGWEPAWLRALNPYSGIFDLAWDDIAAPAASSMAWWLGLGLAGTVFASLRLRGSYLSQIGALPRRLSKRSWYVPPMGNHPMLWKELYFDRTRTIGRVGQWLVWLLILVGLGGSAALVGVMEWHRWFRPAVDLNAIRTQVAAVIYWTSLPGSWLLQWTVGLSASLIVAAEREGATWDALLLSPMTGGEIVRAKILGTLYGMRWVLISLAVAWTTAMAYGAIDLETFCIYVASLLAMGVFMASAGVRYSLASQSVTRAMAFTVGTWLLAAVVTTFAGGALVAFSALLLMLVWSFLDSAQLIAGGAGPPSLMTFMSWQLARYLLYVVGAIVISGNARRSFDRLAGRAVEKHIIRHPSPPRPRQQVPGPPPPPSPPVPPKRPRGAPGRRGRPGGRWQDLD